MSESKTKPDGEQAADDSNAEPPASLPLQDTLHTVTFYSYKGGVGRTLALLNVAVFLAKQGNRVAIADFDLEAPGIDAYKGFEAPSTDQPGLLEYISDYTESKGLVAPALKPYLYETKVAQPCEGPGTIFVLRAGRQDEAYRRRLVKLDWDRLFTKQDGHLFFANMKGELFDEYGCNFLLIDSRTGLTDVGGVCTAYLPDAVILMFYPDEQNLRGTKTVARAIARFEKNEGRPLPRMYCASRIPHLAEKQDLARSMLADLSGLQSTQFDEQLLQQVREVARKHVIPKDHPRAAFQQVASEGWRWDVYVDAAEFGGDDVWYELREGRGAESPSSPGSFVGGDPISEISELPSAREDLVCVRSASLDNCGGYANLATFAAAYNRFERVQLARLIDHHSASLRPKAGPAARKYIERWYPHLLDTAGVKSP